MKSATAHPGSPRRPAKVKTGERVLLAHGGGGQLTDALVGESILAPLSNLALNDLLDSGIVSQADGSSLAMTIDSYVVQPLSFPGGDIGRLAVCGTVNDLAVCGAKPIGLALSLILAEGLERAVLDGVIASIAAAAREAGVHVVTGDTKVVGHGQADGMYITTSGVGAVCRTHQLHPRRVKPGDVLIVSGPIGDHGLAVMLAREMPQVHSALRSDVAPLNGMIEQLLERVPHVVFMRDPTRGGVAAVAADLAARSGYHVTLDESAIPIRPETLHAAEMLGLDPLEVANEGKVVVVVRPQAADDALAALRQHPLGERAAVIGRVEASFDGLCELHTPIGGGGSCRSHTENNCRESANQPGVHRVQHAGASGPRVGRRGNGHRNRRWAGDRHPPGVGPHPQVRMESCLCKHKRRRRRCPATTSAGGSSMRRCAVTATTEAR